MASADPQERESEALWTPLKEGDLALVWNFEVTKYLGRKVHAEWEGPFLLVNFSPHK